VTSELLYGRRPVREALRGPRQVLELWATERALKAEPWLSEADVRLHVAPERELTAEAGTQDHQGVLARVEPFRYADAYELAGILERARVQEVVAVEQVERRLSHGAAAWTRRAAARLPR